MTVVTQKGKYSCDPNLPLVSVCVPTFQHAPYLKECLDSILAQQTDFVFEILIGEDCSTDGTREICLEYAASYPDRIRLFLRKEEEKFFLFGRKSGRLNHLGLYQSAKGKYVCFCDGDDFWCDPTKLQQQVEKMESNPDISLCLTDTMLSGEDGSQSLISGLPSQDKLFTFEELFKRFYLGHISSWMVRNDMKSLVESPIVKKAVPLDQVVFLFYRLKGNVYFLSQTTSVYRYNPTGVYRSQSAKKNYKAQFRNSWYLYRYLHKDTFLYCRAVGYILRRGVDIFVLSKLKRK